MDRKRLPVGYDSFEEIRRGDLYYIDKTLLIKDLLNKAGKVNLFIRPRRFGKTLNMSMLRSFFEIGSDKLLFDGLAISEEKQLCEKYQAKHPVVFLWDVVNHCDKLLDNPKARPKPYWNNTSSNALVKQFIDMADVTTRGEIEQLVAGKTIRKRIVETLTYGELTESIDNLWSVLFLTGYLTADRNAPESDDNFTSLVIPNREAGAGRSDIQIENATGERGIIIETKRARNGSDMETQCDAALKQILDRDYAEPLLDDGVNEVWSYGIAFFKKKCAVKLHKIYG